MTENTPKNGPDDLKDKASNPVEGDDELAQEPDLLFAHIDALMEGSDAPVADPVDLDEYLYDPTDEPAEATHPPDEEPAETHEEALTPISDAPEARSGGFFDDLDEQVAESVIPVTASDGLRTDPDAPIIELGFYGKLPVYGDFIQKRLPQNFINPWHEWLQTGMLACRELDPESWLSFYLNCPAWCFVLGSGICGEQAVAGVTIPSVDRVGRYFNFTMASILPVDTDPAVFAGARHKWFESLENLALSVLDQEMDQDGIDSLINQRSAELVWGRTSRPIFEHTQSHARIVSNDITSVAGFLPALLHQMISGEHGPYGLWWHRGSSQASAQLLSCAGMPVGGIYLGLMMDGELQDISQSASQEPEVDYMDELLSD